MGISTIIIGTNLFAKPRRIFKFLNFTTTSYPSTKQLVLITTMVSQHHRIYSKNTTIRTSPMITKSTCRSSYCRINSTCSNSTKTRRVCYDTDFSYLVSSYKLYSISIFNLITVRNSYNKLYLFTTNRPKISNRYSSPYSSSHCSYYDSNTLKLYRCYNSNNRTWSYLIYIILPGQLKYGRIH
ncbi:LOW QUALITY PROTEIN: hypothetical protein J0S82_007116, partial [Galemys pyrenaicus]